MKNLYAALNKIIRESVAVYWGLLKIMVPVMIIVEIGIRLGLVGLISDFFEPAMGLFGLPAEAAVILATNLLVGLYGAGAALVTISQSVTFSIADMTILGGMMLFAHSMPIEQTIVKKSGTPLLFSTFTRLLAGLVYAWIFHLIYSGMDILNEPATILIASSTGVGEQSWMDWAISSATGLFWVFWILLFLITLLHILEVTGITRALTKMLTPTLRLMGVGPNAAPLTMIGILLGLAFGGALILREIEKGVLTPKSIFISMIFMGYCHSMIEDTLILLAFGGHWSGVLVGRILISILLIIPVSIMVIRMSDETFLKYWFNAKHKIPHPSKDTAD